MRREAGRLRRAFGFALAGIADAWRTQTNLRIEVVVAALAVALAAWLGTGLVPVLLASLVVLSLELVNSAIEALVDLVSPEPHPLAGRAKDLAAGSVLTASALAVAVGIAALGPALVGRLRGLA